MEEHNEEAGVSPEVRKRSIWSRDSLQKTVARRLFRSRDSLDEEIFYLGKVVVVGGGTPRAGGVAIFIFLSQSPQMIRRQILVSDSEEGKVLIRGE